MVPFKFLSSCLTSHVSRRPGRLLHTLLSSWNTPQVACPPCRGQDYKSFECLQASDVGAVRPQITKQLLMRFVRNKNSTRARWKWKKLQKQPLARVRASQHLKGCQEDGCSGRQYVSCIWGAIAASYAKPWAQHAARGKQLSHQIHLVRMLTQIKV